MKLAFILSSMKEIRYKYWELPEKEWTKEESKNERSLMQLLTDREEAFLKMFNERKT
jgi:hypothetical protein